MQVHALKQRAGLYIHVPFCRSKCPYCSFVSVVPTGSLQESYVRALKREMRLWARSRRVSGLVFDTLYIGGGTPTCLPAEEVSRIVREALDLFRWEPGPVEVTVEANPETLDRAYLRALRHARVTRVSIGLQALCKEGLDVLGRRHGVEQGVRAVEWALDAGLVVSVDLIYGWPGQELGGWTRTLETVASLGPQHVSCYELTPEPGTPLFRKVHSGAVSLPGEELVLSMWERVEDVAGLRGYVHYEISNYALDGFECRHNLKYWKGAPYLGIGCSASSYIHPARWTNVRDVARYVTCVEHGLEWVADREVLDRWARFRESVVLGLRLLSGVKRDEWVKNWGADPVKYYGDILYSLRDKGLLHVDEDVVKLTRAGSRLANLVMSELV